VFQSGSFGRRGRTWCKDVECKWEVVRLCVHVSTLKSTKEQRATDRHFHLFVKRALVPSTSNDIGLTKEIDFDEIRYFSDVLFM